VSTKLTADAVVKDLVRCGYLKAADLADRFAGVNIDPAQDTDIVGPTGIFSQTEFDGDREFRKTASVMKMVIDGYAGAGTIAMGGYDYHTGDRSTGEIRDLRAGRCMGACLEYAARRGVPLMMYVFSDGSLASNGTIDNSTDGRGKGVWTGDNSSTAASFFLVYSPNGRTPAIRQQIGWFRGDGSVETASSPAANNVNLLVETVILNYMALNGDIANFASLFNGLGNPPSAALIDSLKAFDTIA
ncbi:MAG TPA: general secretion pathway protein GspF, partial [Gammaproteobacteria bacterium]|nr:general secretion pathway protein GspF [Gammaproteobacteria bacterium]